MTFCGFNEIEAVMQSGNEIAAYDGSVSGFCTTKPPADAHMHDLIRYLKDAFTNPVLSVFSHVPGYPPACKEALKRKNIHCFRFCDTSFNDPLKVHRSHISGIPLSNDSIPSLSEFSSILSRTTGRWLVLRYQQILPRKSSAFKIVSQRNDRISLISEEIFDRHMRMVRNSNFWIAPVSAVIRYLEQARRVTTTVRQNGRSVVVSVSGGKTPLATKVPLTLRISLPWSYAKVTGAIHEGMYVVRNNQITLQALPGTEVSLENVE